MKIIKGLIERYPALQPLKENIEAAVSEIVRAHKNERVLYIAGNGGSAADADHITGELMKGFCKRRELSTADKEALTKVSELGDNLASKLQYGIACHNLTAQAGILTAFANDVDADLIFAQLLYGYAKVGDLFLAISTSGNSKNIINACIAAKAKGVKIISLTGRDGGSLAKLADINIIAPEEDTYKIQEYHLPIYHAICMQVEDILF